MDTPNWGYGQLYINRQLGYIWTKSSPNRGWFEPSSSSKSLA